MLYLILFLTIFLVISLLSYRFFRSLDCDLTLYLCDKFGKSLKTLNHKVIWITGASSGIGEELAFQLSNINCKLVISGTNVDRLQEVKEKCLSTSTNLKSTDILIVPFDIANTSVHQQALNDVLHHFEKVDILINNAGKSQRAQFHQIELDVDKKLFDINVFGTINLSRVLLRYWQANNIKGQFLVTSSTAGKIGVPFSATYTATKHALHGYFECLRIERPVDDIKITIACPGPVFSNIYQNAYTSKVGETVGKTHDLLSNRMKTCRCARLMLIGMIHGLDELWIANQPVLLIYYFAQYMPTISRFFMENVMDKKKFGKMRDGE